MVARIHYTTEQWKKIKGRNIHTVMNVTISSLTRSYLFSTRTGGMFPTGHAILSHVYYYTTGF